MLLDSELARMAEARCLRLLDRPAEAAHLLGESDRFFRVRRIHPRRAQVLLELAGAQMAQRDLRRAKETAQRALRLAERLELPSLKCAARCLRSDLLLLEGKPDQAESALATVPPLLDQLPLRDRLSYWTAAARAARGRGNTRVALGRYRRAARCLEAERALIPGLELRARSFEQGVRIYHEQIALLASNPRVRLDPVLRLMELARGRTFRELLETGGQKARDEVVEMRAELGSLVKRLDTLIMSGRPGEGDEAERLRRQILSLERAITTRIRRLEASHPSEAGTLSLRRADQIAERLRPSETLIEYFVVENRILAAVVTKEARFLRVLPGSADELRSNLDHLRLQLDSFAANASRPLGNIDFLRRGAEARLNSMHRTLLRPLLQEIPAPAVSPGRLTIVPHDLLHQVPFECLHDGERYLDESWEVTRCPTADFLVQRRSKRTETPPGEMRGDRGHAAGVALHRGRGARGVGIVARRVEGALDRSLPRGGPRPPCAGPSLIHLSAHGSFREDNPLFSTLHLGKGVLFLADILETRLSADLAILSACNTGQVFSGRGDALLGVAHAFLAAGSRRLVASLWRVHDGATARWMELFHQAMRDSGDAAASLRSAGAP